MGNIFGRRKKSFAIIQAQNPTGPGGDKLAAGDSSKVAPLAECEGSQPNEAQCDNTAVNEAKPQQVSNAANEVKADSEAGDQPDIVTKSSNLQKSDIESSPKESITETPAEPKIEETQRASQTADHIETTKEVPTETEIKQQQSVVASETEVNQSHSVVASETEVSQPQSEVASETEVNQPQSAEASETEISQQKAAGASETEISQQKVENASETEVSQQQSVAASEAEVSQQLLLDASETEVSQQSVGTSETEVSQERSVNTSEIKVNQEQAVNASETEMNQTHSVDAADLVSSAVEQAHEELLKEEDMFKEEIEGDSSVTTENVSSVPIEPVIDESLSFPASDVSNTITHEFDGDAPLKTPLPDNPSDTPYAELPCENGPTVMDGPGDKVATEFRWAHGGTKVFVSGTFNQWQLDFELKKIDEVFIGTLDLPLGEYQYKFIVDDQWVVDKNQVVVSDDGKENNQIIVAREVDETSAL